MGGYSRRDGDGMSETAQADIIDLLRMISRESTAEISEPNGFTYYRNIGNLANMAADEIIRLRAIISENENQVTA